MVGNTRLRVVNDDFRQSIDLWHSGVNAPIWSRAGSLVVEITLLNPLDERARGYHLHRRHPARAPRHALIEFIGV